jgi:hypothetical protein
MSKGANMTSHSIDQLLQHAAELTPSERLLLAARLIQGVRDEIPAQKSKRKWKDAMGLLKYPILEEDAQAYISRTRRAQDNHRAHVIREEE